MSETVLSTHTLPEVILSFFNTDKVVLRDEDGVITLFPVPLEQAAGHPPELTREYDIRTKEEMKADILQKVKEAEKDFAAGRMTDAYESLSQLRVKHGI